MSFVSEIFKCISKIQILYKISLVELCEINYTSASNLNLTS